MSDDKLKIKVIVDGRYQELEIQKDAEEIVREAAKRVNSMLFDSRSKFKLDDTGDYIRLVALQFATVAVQNEYNDKASTMANDLKEVQAKLEEHLTEIQ